MSKCVLGPLYIAFFSPFMELKSLNMLSWSVCRASWTWTAPWKKLRNIFTTTANAHPGTIWMASIAHARAKRTISYINSVTFFLETKRPAWNFSRILLTDTSGKTVTLCSSGNFIPNNDAAFNQSFEPEQDGLLPNSSFSIWTFKASIMVPEIMRTAKH